MATKEPSPFLLRRVYPSMRGGMGLGRRLYKAAARLGSLGKTRPETSPVVPDAYKVCNSGTVDSELDLACASGTLPADLDGSLFVCQCLGSPEAFMVGDTNIARLDFGPGGVKLTNRLMWTPAALARLELEKTRHRFDFLGLMYLSPGLGLFSYTEGMYLLPDGRIAVTSDVDRPWIVERDSLRAVTPLGRRDEWLPMMADQAGELMGTLFAGYNNSHVTYTDTETGEVLLVSWQGRQADGSHPVKLMSWDGAGDLKSWRVVGEDGEDIEIKQSIHELAFSRDWILLADTAFVAGMEMLTPWVNAPLPSPRTAVYLVDRRELQAGTAQVRARRVEVDEPCIHLVAEYENPGDKVTFYALHTPATNTAELLHHGDRDLDGQLFPERLVGYGTLPVLDLSSVGKHVLDAKGAKVESSTYLAEMPWTWGPYLYAYMGRQLRPYAGQDLFVLFKGFSKAMLPKRIHDAYKDVERRRVPLADMVGGPGLSHNNSICRVAAKELAVADAYAFPDKVLCHTVSCLESSGEGRPGYLVAGVVTDDKAGPSSSGSEYWIFEADKLAKGPVCKLAHPELDNATLFHTVYVPAKTARRWEGKQSAYRVPQREDYPRGELAKWEACVTEAFEKTIWPYFDPRDPEAAKEAEARAARLAARRLPKLRAPVGAEDLIGEERVDPSNAAAFAERMLAEAERMWKSAGWRLESAKGGVTIESKPVSGCFAAAGVLVARSEGVVDAPAQAVFDLLVSPEGYAILDPVSDPEDHKLPPLETYAWRPGSRLEAATAATKMPGKGSADFVVLNAIDPASRIFVSKSIAHAARPGGSPYSQEGPQPDGHTRALNTMAIKTEALPDGRCRLLVLNYADIPGGAQAFVMNLINTKFFFRPLYKRIAKAVKAGAAADAAAKE